LFHQVETQKESDEKIVPGSIDYIKSKKPLYFTFTHHFYNQLSGHCKSLPPSIENLRPQKYGSDLGLRKQGEEVIRQLLSNENGQRVLIDIKHMNPRARNSYYKILDEFESKGDQIPIVFSHGGANGMDSNTVTNDKLHNEEIGLYDDEIIRLVRSGGLFGLNLDERVMSSDDSLKKTRKKICPKKRFEATSGLIWNNIEQIVKVTAKEKLNPWHSICIGSDYDGIINPINGFWTLKYMPRLRKYLEKHLQHFFNDHPELAYNMSSDEIMDAMFSNNTIRFIIKHFGS
jgi:microsomal dipeptidase-like Zn-dependent dipeptidase